MDTDHFLISATALRAHSALEIADTAFRVIGVIAEDFVKILGNWLLSFVASASSPNCLPPGFYMMSF